MKKNTISVELTIEEAQTICKALFLLSAHYEDKDRYTEASFCDDIYYQLSEVIKVEKNNGAV